MYHAIQRDKTGLTFHDVLLLAHLYETNLQLGFYQLHKFLTGYYPQKLGNSKVYEAMKRLQEKQFVNLSFTPKGFKRWTISIAGINYLQKLSRK